MATRVAVAQMHDRAIGRLSDAMRRVADELAVAPPVLPEFNRDPAYLDAERLTVMADWLEQVAAALTPTEKGQSDMKATIYDQMTAGDLARITRERGLEKPDVITLGEWADWLAAHDEAAAAPSAPPEDTGAGEDAPVKAKKGVGHAATQN